MAMHRVGGEAQSCREGGRLQTPRKSLGDQWPHWCGALKKAAHWHDVIFYMPSVIPPPPAIRPDEHTDTVLTTWDHEEEANVNVGSVLCGHFFVFITTDFLIRNFWTSWHFSPVMCKNQTLGQYPLTLSSVHMWPLVTTSRNMGEDTGMSSQTWKCNRNLLRSFKTVLELCCEVQGSNVVKGCI